MPTINLNRKPRVYDSNNKNEIHKHVYNTLRWKKLRLQKLRENPLCEKCLELGKLTPAQDVHHIKEISKGENIEEKQELGFNYDNLKSLCQECHHKIHNNLYL